MKTKNLKKLILLGLTSLLTANFSVLGMEEKNEIEEEKNEININTEENLSDDEDSFEYNKLYDDEYLPEKKSHDNESTNSSKNLSYYESINGSENSSDYESIDIKNTDQIINQISDIDPWDNFNYLSARSIYMNEKEKYERMKKIYERLDEENIDKDTEKFMNNHHFSDIYDNCYEKIIDYMGFNNEPEKEGYYKKGYYDDDKYYIPPSYKSKAYKKLEEAIDLIKDINHSTAKNLIQNLKNLRKKIGNLIGDRFDDRIFEKHFCYTLKTIYYEAKYCLDYLEKITGVETSEREFAKKFLEFLEELEEKQKKSGRYLDYDYCPDKKKIEDKFYEYIKKYDSYAGLRYFVKDICDKYDKLKKIIERTHTKVKRGKGKEEFYKREPNYYATGNVYDNHCIGEKEFDPDYSYEDINLFSISTIANSHYENNVDMISKFLDSLKETAKNLENKNLIK